MQDFEAKTALITGGASGMGLAMAENFARAGTNIVLADVEEGALNHIPVSSWASTQFR